MKKIIAVDFPNEQVANIFGARFYNSAKILDVDFKYSTALFGDNQWHYKMILTGQEKAIKEFTQFVKKSIELADLDIPIQETTDSPSTSSSPFTEEDQKILEEFVIANNKILSQKTPPSVSNIIHWTLTLSIILYLIFS